MYENERKGKPFALLYDIPAKHGIELCNYFTLKIKTLGNPANKRTVRIVHPLHIQRGTQSKRNMYDIFKTPLISFFTANTCVPIHFAAISI